MSRIKVLALYFFYFIFFKSVTICPYTVEDFKIISRKSVLNLLRKQGTVQIKQVQERGEAVCNL